LISPPYAISSIMGKDIRERVDDDFCNIGQSPSRRFGGIAA
jgi:hypothetical protein